MRIKNRDRLEPPTPSCHAAAVAYISGKRVYAWFGGEREGSPDTCLYLMYKGSVRPVRLAPASAGIPAWNPVFFQYGGSLRLVFKLGRFCDCWQSVACTVAAAGDHLTLQNVQLLPAGFNGPVKSSPVVCQEGPTELAFCGSSVETALRWDSYLETMELASGRWICRRGAPVQCPDKGFKGLIQPALWREGGTSSSRSFSSSSSSSSPCSSRSSKSGSSSSSSSPSIRALLRSGRGGGAIYEACWVKAGPAWVAPRAAARTGFPNPNSGIDVIKHSSGRVFLAYNPSAEERTPLVLQELDTTGAVCTPLGDPLQLAAVSAGQAGGTDEVSYPYLTETPAGEILCVYTHRRTHIGAVTIEI